MLKWMKRGFASRQLRFALVGAFNTVLGFLIFVLIGLFVPTTALLNLFLAYVPTTLVGFLIQKYLVWKTSGTVYQELPRFLALTLIQATVNAFLLWLAVDLLGHDKFIVQGTITALAVVISYAAQRNWVFRAHQTNSQ
jgi:putative flippase GtrA